MTLKSDSGQTAQSDPKLTQKWLWTYFRVIFESLLSHLGSLWGGTQESLLSHFLGHFNSCCVSVELGGRPLYNVWSLSERSPSVRLLSKSCSASTKESKLNYSSHNMLRGAEFGTNLSNLLYVLIVYSSASRILIRGNGYNCIIQTMLPYSCKRRKPFRPPWYQCCQENGLFYGGPKSSLAKDLNRPYEGHCREDF